MSKMSAVLKAIGYAFGTAIAVSLTALVVVMCLFGFQFAEWAEWQGRIAGVVGTIAGITGAAIGLRIALRTERRAIQ